MMGTAVNHFVKGLLTFIVPDQYYCILFCLFCVRAGFEQIHVIKGN